MTECCSPPAVFPANWCMGDVVGMVPNYPAPGLPINNHHQIRSYPASNTCTTFKGKWKVAITHPTPFKPYRLEIDIQFSDGGGCCGCPSKCHIPVCITSPDVDVVREIHKALSFSGCFGTVACATVLESDGMSGVLMVEGIPCSCDATHATISISGGKCQGVDVESTWEYSPGMNMKGGCVSGGLAAVLLTCADPCGGCDPCGRTFEAGVSLPTGVMGEQFLGVTMPPMPGEGGCCGSSSCVRIITGDVSIKLEKPYECLTNPILYYRYQSDGMHSTLGAFGFAERDALPPGTVAVPAYKLLRVAANGFDVVINFPS